MSDIPVAFGWSKGAVIEAVDKYIKSLHRDIHYKDKALEKKNRLIKSLQEEIKSVRTDWRLESMYKLDWKVRCEAAERALGWAVE